MISLTQHMVGSGVGVKSHICAVRGKNVAGKPLYMNGGTAVQLVFKIYSEGVSRIRKNDQELDLFVGLRKFYFNV